MVSTDRLENLLKKWGAFLVELILRRLAGDQGHAGDLGNLDVEAIAHQAATVAARDAAAQVVTAVLAAVIIQRARKSAVATVASRVAGAQLVEGYPVNMFHLCVSDTL